MIPAPGSFTRRSVRVRRLALRVVVFLLLGAVVNVAAAWGCVVLPIGDAERGRIDMVSQDDSHVASHLLMSKTAAASATYFVYKFKHPKDVITGAFPTITYVLPGWADRSTFAPTTSLYFDAWGWPALSMWSVTEVADDAEASATVHGGIALGAPPAQQPGRPQVLPLRPIWPGFVINTCLYAATIWLLFAAPGSVRRWRRNRRGLCAKCAYPIGTNDVCTECGGRVIKANSMARGSMGLPPPATPAGLASERGS